jgi:hypothetical protein
VSVPTASCSPSGDHASAVTAPAADSSATSAPVRALYTRTVAASSPVASSSPFGLKATTREYAFVDASAMRAPVRASHRVVP